MSDALPDTSAAVLASLERLHARLDRIEARLESVESLTHQIPAGLAMVTDTADSLVSKFGEGELVDRLGAAVKALETLTRPEVLGLLQVAAEQAPTAPGMVAMVVDTLDGMADQIAATGIPLHERVEILLRAAERLSSPAALEVLTVTTQRLVEIKALLESGVLAPESVQVVSLAGKALVASRQCECGPVGPWGALTALKEPEIQRALGFMVAFARQFGAALDGKSFQLSRV